MTEEANPAGNATGTPEAPPADPTGNNLPELLLKAQADAAEWQKRAIGWQKQYQEEQKKYTESSAKFLDADTQIKTVTGQLEELRATHSTTAEEKDQAFTELETTKAQLERLKIVTSEFPELVPLLQGDDVLPDGTGEELRGKLKSLSERISGMRKGAMENDLQGSSLDNPPASALKGKDALLKQAIDAMRKGNMEEYEKLYSQYVNQNPGG